MDVNVAATGVNAFSVDPGKVASVGDANFLEIQKTLGAGFKELEALRNQANQISAEGVDVKA